MGTAASSPWRCCCSASAQPGSRFRTPDHVSIARGVQAIGGGAVVPVAMALVTQHASPVAGAPGLGAMAAASEAGGLLGPLWGGGMADLLGWRGVFWINLPLCLPLAAACGGWRPPRSAPTRAKLDLPGAVLHRR